MKALKVIMVSFSGRVHHRSEYSEDFRQKRGGGRKRGNSGNERGWTYRGRV